MRGSPRLIKVLIGIAAVATNLPIFAGYLVSFGLLVWLLATGHWRLALIGKKHLPPPGHPDYHYMQAIAAGIKPLHWGSFCLVVAHLLAAVLGVIWSPWSLPLGKTLADWSHMATKLGLLWLVVSTGLIVQVRLGWEPRRVARWLMYWLVAQLGYCLVQHWTGIDWAHGFQAVLGAKRYAYGVYRVSGFMGHPLTLAYNLMLISVAAAALAWRMQPLAVSREVSENDQRWWLGSLMICVATLLISGSRYVLIVLIGVLLLCEYRRLWRHKVKVVLGATICCLLLWWEGSVIGRFAELFQPGQSLDQRFTRLVFWRIHWQMFIDSPVFGVTRTGLDNALKAYYTAAGYHDTMYEAHNLFLQYLADTGLVGFAGLLAWFVGLFVARRRLKALTAGAQGLGYLTAATFLCALMQNNLRDSAFVYALWFYLSLLLIESAVHYAKQQESAGHERKPPKNLESRTCSADPAPYL